METLTLNKSAHLVEDEIKDLLKSRSLDLVNVLFTDTGPKNVVTIISQAENLSATQNQNFPGYISKYFFLICRWDFKITFDNLIFYAKMFFSHMKELVE